MNSLSRRQLLKTASVATALLATPKTLWAATKEPLYIPPLIEVRRGRPIILTMQETRYALDGKHRVDVWGFNGQYLGPTIKIKSGSFAKLTYHNNLPQNVALSIQGLQASGELFGAVEKVIKKGESWSPIVPINQPAATCWYRASTLANSAYQTYRGLFGMWIIEDEYSDKLDLPQKYGVNDIPVILQDMELNGSGSQLFKPNQPNLLGNRLLVNGQQTPYLKVQRGWIRLRLLNASVSRIYQLHFDDEREMQLIAKGLGFLAETQAITALDLAPGERAEILVNMNDSDAVSLISGEKRNFLDKVTQIFSHSDELIENTVLELIPEGELSAFDNKPNMRFNSDAGNMLMNETVIVTERTFYLDTTNGLINQNRFNPRRIDVVAKFGTIERWVLTSSAPVGFTIQGAKFVIEQQNDLSVKASDFSWQDTVLIQGKTKILVKYDNLSSNGHPFIFGASNLALADLGCIGMLVVQ